MTRLHPLRVRAFAKVNLDLRVLRRRTDGYHDISTIFQTLTLHDTLWFSPRRGPLELSATSTDIPVDRTNLVWKAARAVWRARGRRGEPHGLAVRIVKRIPVQAGLGGGSSDAAATLLALNQLWDVKLSSRDLYDLAATLGSDVPFFLLGGTALGLGRGEVLYPLPDLPPRPVVIARPLPGVSTAQAYAWLAAERGHGGRPRRLAVPWPPGSLDALNDFERVVFRRLPAAARLRRALEAGGADLAMLSGSGSAVFGVFPGEPSARRAAALVGASAVGVWLTRFRGRRRRRPPVA